MEFNETWISVQALHDLRRLVERVESVPGAIIEFGCWEGRSLVHIAQAAPQRPVHAVDHWRGNDGDLYTQDAVATRDVYAQFIHNTAQLDNIVIHRMTTEQFMRRWNDPIALIHLDADHRYGPVKAQIEWALSLLSPGGVLCGDDYSHLWEGVMKAVDETLPDRDVLGCMWVHVND